MVTIYLNADLFPFTFSTKAKNKQPPPPLPKQERDRQTDRQTDSQTQRERDRVSNGLLNTNGKIQIILTVKVVCKVAPIAKLKQRKKNLISSKPQTDHTFCIFPH